MGRLRLFGRRCAEDSSQSVAAARDRYLGRPLCSVTGFSRPARELTVLAALPSFRCQGQLDVDDPSQGTADVAHRQ
jgi:hypothetical protein